MIRLTLLLLGMSLLTLSTTTLNITDGFEELLKPFKRFGVPAHELATMMGIALRFLPQFATELQTIYRAQVSRGANFKTNARGTFSMMVALIVPLFTSAFRHAERSRSAWMLAATMVAPTVPHSMSFGFRNAIWAVFSI